MIPLSRAHSVREFELFLGRADYDSGKEYAPTHAGACAKDEPQIDMPATCSVARVIIGTIKVSRETGEVVLG